MSCLLCTSRQLLCLQNNSGCGPFTVPLRSNCLAPSFLLETAPAPRAYAPSPLLKAGAQESLLAPLCSLSFTFNPSSNPVRIPWKHPTRLHPQPPRPPAWVAPPRSPHGWARLSAATTPPQAPHFHRGSSSAPPSGLTAAVPWQSLLHTTPSDCLQWSPEPSAFRIKPRLPCSAPTTWCQPFSSTLSHSCPSAQLAFFPIPELAALSPTHHGSCSRLYPDWSITPIFSRPVSAETPLPPQRSFATTFNSGPTHTVGFLHSGLLNSYGPTTHFLCPFTARLSIILWTPDARIRPVSTAHASPGPRTEQVWSAYLVWMH